jgi:hypothetical protein
MHLVDKASVMNPQPTEGGVVFMEHLIHFQNLCLIANALKYVFCSVLEGFFLVWFGFVSPTEMYCLTILWRPQVQDLDVRRTGSVRKELFCASSLLLVDCWQFLIFLVCRHISPPSAFIFTWHSSCVFIARFLKSAVHIGLGVCPSPIWPCLS